MFFTKSALALSFLAAVIKTKVMTTKLCMKVLFTHCVPGWTRSD